MTLTAQTVDMRWYRIMNASTWRARFLKAAERAARRVSEYLSNREDYENAARWKDRELRIRECAKRTNLNTPGNE
jgi:hypothetical protein